MKSETKWSTASGIKQTQLIVNVNAPPVQQPGQLFRM